jgi:hypothetical protein
MKIESKKRLRILFSIGFLITSANALIMYLGFPEQSDEISYALGWHTYGALIPHSISMPIWCGTILTMLIGGIGFLLFQNWARITLASLTALSVVLVPFQGLYVNTAFHEFLYLAGNSLMFIALVLSFTTPCKSYFKQTEPAGTGQPCNPSENPRIT